jgi:tetratricopeptide (TPR) repeat protein
MHIRRDYSNSFFDPNKSKNNYYVRLFFIFGLIIGAFLVYVRINFDTLQEKALDVVGLSPTATPLPNDLATLGANLVLAGDLEAAADLFERALDQRPNNIDYLHEYGQVLIELDEPERAIELAERIIDLNPADPRGYALKARAQVWMNNYSEAIPTVLAGLEVNDRYAPLYASLSRAYTYTGRYLDGVEMGLRGIESDPTSVEARRSYAYALSWIGESEEATAQLEIALALDLNYVPTHFELAGQYLAQNRDQEAIDLYDRILALQPRNSRAMLRLCETYRKVGQFERAIGYCGDAVIADPTSTSAHFQLGLLQYNRFEFTGAIESFSQCLVYAPDDLDCKYRLGLSYFYSDDCDTAWDILQESLQMARSQSNTDTEAAHIQEGLVAITQKCPAYGGHIALPEATPEITPEPAANTGE